ncbi:(Fe-S)-binding protein [Nitratidesulfovibrio vulgaris]|uniref:(Fe-S)-binding protein n=1 Tax=Nitratidesulfovibrio vulgaris TaxID=881 RepID=UPI0023002D1B|nr:(Fe-S)-binding protein [Nitratidesulfovibrio vulgaris]WCB47477.1 (Fe-S)-binding protein [Nitratidesulfovibrio vulgaris]
MTSTPPQDDKQCLLCGQCLAVCPVFLATGREELSPKAKQHLLRHFRERPEALAEAPVRVLADRCLSCGRCAVACPHHLSVPDALARLRSGHPLWHQWVWRRWIEQGRLLWPALAQASRLVPQVVAPEALRPMLRSAASMLAGNRPAPWLRVSRYDTETGKGQVVLLFAGCTARRIRPRWLHTAKALLRGLGYSIAEGRGFTCCGSTLDHAGIPDAAASARAVNLAVWRAAGRPVLATFCATCHHGLAAYVDDDTLGWADGEREAWREALRPLSTLWGTTAFETREAAPEAIRYHQPCHWYGKDPDLVWLRDAMPGRVTTPGGPVCCGMGGVLQLADANLSQEVASDCWRHLLPSEAAASPAPDTHSATSGNAPDGQSPDVPGLAGPATDDHTSRRHNILTGCSGCTLQLTATAPADATVHHWLDIIDPVPAAVSPDACPE